MKYSKYKIQDNRITFEFYEFYFSSLRKKKNLTLDRIKEVNFNTIPVSMEIDDGEIIFFNHGDDLRIKGFVDKHKIRESNKVDVWNLLCNEFLDTELTETAIESNQRILTELKFSVVTIKEIRKKIKWILFGTTEWVYLGHWDLLAMKQARNIFYRLRGSDFYWWTMKIASKGKKMPIQSTTKRA